MTTWPDADNDPKIALMITSVEHNNYLDEPQAAQTLFVIYVRDNIALRFEPFKAGVHLKPVSPALNLGLGTDH